MRKNIFVCTCIFIAVFVAQSAFAAKSADPGVLDKRIRTFTYDENQVYSITCSYGVETHISFGADEEILHASAGDSAAWMVVVSENHVFIKPRMRKADTNLVVLTNLHRYNFELRAKQKHSIRDKSLTFAVRFSYPEKELKASLAQARLKRKKAAQGQYNLDQEITPGGSAPWQWNLDYTKKGNKVIAPSHVFDDGRHTYFQFPEEIDKPAIFMVGNDKNESLVNYHVKGKYVVVHRIAHQFVIRHGKKAACIFNKRFKDRIEQSKVPDEKGGEGEQHDRY